MATTRPPPPQQQQLSRFYSFILCQQIAKNILSILTGAGQFVFAKLILQTLFSVARLGDLLDFGQLFKAVGNNQLAQISCIIWVNFVKVSKSLIVLVKSFLGNFYRHLATFYWSHCLRLQAEQTQVLLRISLSLSLFPLPYLFLTPSNYLFVLYIHIYPPQTHPHKFT